MLTLLSDQLTFKLRHFIHVVHTKSHIFYGNVVANCLASGGKSKSKVMKCQDSRENDLYVEKWSNNEKDRF